MQSSRIGAIPDEGGTTFRVWALGHAAVSVEVEGHGSHLMVEEDHGYFIARLTGVGPDDRYWFRIDGGDRLPDLASRFQPDGVSGPSQIVDTDFPWTDQDWPGIGRHDNVLYEMHVGTFTPEGTWTAAAEKLDHLKQLGISVIHVMPIAAFEGRFGWGYDTVMLFAPFAPYGEPAALAAFVDAAHRRGIGVILDVVYNHVGIGHVHGCYSKSYFTDRHRNEWGESFNFDGDDAKPVRDYVISNAVYWIRDFHFDGLRFDATQAMVDYSDTHIIAEIASEIRAAASDRSLYLIAENHPQDRRLIEPPDEAGYGLDAIVSDDFQHAARVAITGHNDFYYRDYLGRPQELLSALKYGFLYQGQRSDMRDGPYGTYNLDMPPERFVHFLENHDQVANSALGLRLSKLGSPGRVRAFTAMLLLGPQTPCLFQGQEFGSSRPFLYFLGLDGEDAKSVAAGRLAQLANFPSVQDPQLQAAMPDPADDETFRRSKLDWSDAERHVDVLALHQDLIALRRDLPALLQASDRKIDGAVIGDHALLLRFTTDSADADRLLLFNFGLDLQVGVVAEPLLAPPQGRKWVVDWSSEEPRYGGGGVRPTDTDRFWILPGDCAVMMKAEAKR